MLRLASISAVALYAVVSLFLSNANSEVSRGPAFLIRDIGMRNAVFDSMAPQAGVADGSRAFFFASAPATGLEPWVSDGTEEGTRLIRDTEPGRGWAGAIESLSGRVIDGRFVFRTSSGLWIANREATTAAYVDLAGESVVSEIGQVGDAALVMTRSERRSSLWAVRPGANSPTLLRRLDDASNPHVLFPQRPAQFTEVGDRTYFVAREPSTGLELWETDGTVDGTHVAVDLEPGPADSSPAYLTESGGRLYFQGVGGGRAGLWVTSGGAVNFVFTLPPVVGLILAASSDGVFLGGNSFFGGVSTIWHSDGTAAGTVELASVTQPVFPGVEYGVAVGDTLFAVVNRSRPSTAIWSIDRLTGIVREIETSPTRGTRGVGDLKQWGDRLAFTAYDRDSEWRIWTVGPGNTAPTAVTNRGLDPENGAAMLLPLIDRLLYSGSSAEMGRELMQTDVTGATAGTVANIAPDVDSGNPSYLAPVGGRLFFSALFPRLWTTDGTAQGTVEIDGPTLTSIIPQFGLSGTSGFGFELGGHLVFTAEEVFRMGQVWVSDGTIDGTFSLVDTRLTLATLTKIGSRGYFVVGNDAGPPQLWGTDGTLDGTGPVAPLHPAIQALIPGDDDDRVLSIVGNWLFGAPWTLHSTDVGERTTTQLASFLSPPSGPLGPPKRFESLHEHIYFAAPDVPHGDELWVTDGTVAGTRLALDLNPKRTVTGGTIYGVGSEPQDLTVLGDRILFFADDGEHGFELWSSDGTSPGSGLVRDIVAGPGSSINTFVTNLGVEPVNESTQLIAASGRAFFVVDDRVHGRELWVTDGYTEGTVMLRDIMPGPLGSNPSALSIVDGVLVFNACDELGCEVWTSDGTESGTVQLADVYPGPLSSSPRDFKAAGEIVYFSAHDDRGVELWGFPRSSLPTPAPTVERPPPTPRPTPGPRPCAGDCDENGRVSIAELIRGVAIALGEQPLEGCAAFDVDKDGRVRISELVAAVNSALVGC